MEGPAEASTQPLVEGASAGGAVGADERDR